MLAVFWIFTVRVLVTTFLPIGASTTPNDALTPPATSEL